MLSFLPGFHRSEWGFQFDPRNLAIRKEHQPIRSTSSTWPFHFANFSASLSNVLDKEAFDRFFSQWILGSGGTTGMIRQLLSFVSIRITNR